MRIFNLTKIDSGLEKQVEAEAWGTNKTNNNTLGFILFVVLHSFYKSMSECSGLLALSANIGHRPSVAPISRFDMFEKHVSNLQQSLVEF